MGKGGRRLGKVIFVCILLIGTHSLWLPLPAKFLTVKDNFDKADALVALTGDWTAQREETASELYKKGFSSRIIRMLEAENMVMAGAKAIMGLDVNQRNAYAGYFQRCGVPESALILGQEKATSTYDELKAVKEIVLRYDIKSIIVVTGDYHMRRALMTAKWVFRGSDIKIYNASTHSKYVHPKEWWLYENDIKDVVIEYGDIGFYLIYHFMLGK